MGGRNTSRLFVVCQGEGGEDGRPGLPGLDGLPGMKGELYTLTLCMLFLFLQDPLFTHIWWAHLNASFA